MAVNPYSTRQTVAGEAPGAALGLPIHARYAVPDMPDAAVEGYDEENSPQLGPQDVPSTPDPVRTNRVEPHVTNPNDRAYSKRVYGEKLNRQSDDITHESWNVQQHKVPPGQDPKWKQEREPIRPSAVRSPLGYMFERYWHIPRNINDAVPGSEDHISMADHRRVYPIYGQMPRDRVGTNTFRLDPQPWDRGLVSSQNVTSEPLTAGGAQLGNRAFRL